MPNKTDRARLSRKYLLAEKAAFIAHIQQQIHLTKKPLRSGYAFSQQEGWGPLITSGRMKSKLTTRIRPSNLLTVSKTEGNRVHILCYSMIKYRILHILKTFDNFYMEI